MQPRTREREFQAVGVVQTREYSVKLDAHLMQILSSLYSNIPWAIVREYWTNAEDGHRELRRLGLEPPHPIKIHVPNSLEPYFEVQDFGIGMNSETVFEIYTQYGNSTKNHDNFSIGGLGIGAKSAFCYEEATDQWTIEARFDGKIHSYSAAKDARGMPTLVLLGEADTDEPNGVTIKIPVTPKDFGNFKDAISRMAKRRLEPFEISGDPGGKDAGLYDPIQYDSKTDKFGWRKRGSGEHGVQVVMGGVPYPVDLRHKDLELSSAEIKHFDKQGSMDLFFGIGELDIIPAREGLHYTTHTVTQLKATFRDLFKEDVQKFQNDLDAQLTFWDAVRFLKENSHALEIYNKYSNLNTPISWRGYGNITDKDPEIKQELDSLAAMHNPPLDPSKLKVAVIVGTWGGKTERRPDILPGSVLSAQNVILDGTQRTAVTYNYATHTNPYLAHSMLIADCPNAISLAREWAGRHASGSVIYVFQGDGWDKDIISNAFEGAQVGLVSEATFDIRLMRESQRRNSIRRPANVRFWDGYNWQPTEVDINNGGLYVKLNDGELDPNELPNGIRTSGFKNIVQICVNLGIIKRRSDVIGIPKSRWSTFENHPGWKDFWKEHLKTLQDFAKRAIPAEPIETTNHWEKLQELKYFKVGKEINLESLPKKSPLKILHQTIEKRKSEIEALDARLKTFTNIAHLRRILNGDLKGKTLKRPLKTVDIQTIIDYDKWLDDRYPMLSIMEHWKYSPYIYSDHKQVVQEYIEFVDKHTSTKNTPKLT